MIPTRDWRWRRSQRDRIRHKRLRRMYWLQKFADIIDPDDADRIVAIAIDTPCRCSKWCCGNPRRWFKKRTLDELLVGIELKGELDDLSS